MRRILAIALPTLLVATTACRTDYFEDAVADYWLELALDATETTAGEPVPYEVILHSTSGGELPVEYTITTELEPSLYYSDERLYPTVAGLHTLSATATHDGEDLETTVDLTVLTGPAAQLDLVISDLSTVVGDNIAYTVGMWDFYGNSLDSSDVSFEADSADLEVAESAMTSWVPGVYTLTASYEALTDAESMVFVVGDAASIELTLSDTDLERFETSHATVRVLDVHGNETDDPWILSVEAHDGADPGDVTITNANLTFMDEGKFTVWAVAYTDTGELLEDSVGPLLVDTTGPLLEIDTPTRGDWNVGSAGTVSGWVSDEWSPVEGLQVNGADVSWGADGSFSTDVEYDFGTNLVETYAWDADLNETDDLRAVLAGEFLPYGSGLGNGLLARLNQGGLDTIEGLGEGLVNDIDLDSMIPSPVWSDESETCLDLGWLGEYCWTWYSIYFYITSPYIGSTDLELTPQSGYLDATATIHDAGLNWSANGVVMEISYSGSGSVDASAITVDMDLTPYVSGGVIYVDVTNIDVDTSGFDFDWDSWLWDVIDFFGFDLDGIIAGYVEDAIEDVIADEVPAILEDTLGSLELATDLDFEDNSYAFEAVPYALGVDTGGITLSLATYFTANNWYSPYGAEGSLYAGYSSPSWATTPGMYIGVSDDFLNQAMLALWGGGLLDMQMGGEELGLDTADLEFIFPELTELHIITEALLPPVVVPGTGTGLLDMHLGDLELSLYGGPIDDPNNLMLQAYVSIFSGMDVEVDSDLTLSMELVDTLVAFDVVHPQGNTLGASDTEDLLYALVPLIMPMLTDALGEIPMPEIEGFALNNITIGTGGAEDGFLTLGGDLDM